MKSPRHQAREAALQALYLWEVGGTDVVTALATYFQEHRPDASEPVKTFARALVLGTAGEVDALGEQLEARKVIDRAKGVLIDECGLKENEAFSFIQRTAMSERSRMREVAERVLDGSLRP